MLVSVSITFYSLAQCAANVPLVSALEFRCCRVIPLTNQKLTFDEKISFITRYDDFSLRSHRAVSLQVAPFLRDWKGRGNLPVKRKTSEFIVNWFKLISKRDFNLKKINFPSLSTALPYDAFRSTVNNWHQYCKGIFRTHRLPRSTWIRHHLI